MSLRNAFANDKYLNFLHNFLSFFHHSFSDNFLWSCSSLHRSNQSRSTLSQCLLWRTIFRSFKRSSKHWSYSRFGFLQSFITTWTIHRRTSSISRRSIRNQRINGIHRFSQFHRHRRSQGLHLSTNSNLSRKHDQIRRYTCMQYKCQWRLYVVRIVSFRSINLEKS